LSRHLVSSSGAARLRLPDQDAQDSQPPLRAELFSVDQMEQHGRALAKTHALSTSPTPDRLLRRLGSNERALEGARTLLTSAVQGKLPISPAGEWLLDNFYLIDEHIRAARRDLPPGYSRELPQLAQGPSRGLPRVYDLALEAISHGDGRVDAEGLLRFVAAYQTESLLTLGELWAVPIMLRLALIENLRRVGARITAARLQLNQAQTWATQMLRIASSDPKSLILVVADMARSEPPMVSPFVAELARRLQGQGPALALPLTWIEQWLAESSLTIEQMVQSENQQQAADQVSISNTIGSLRFLSLMEWREFVETMSAVEQVLRTDPVGVYAAMDAASRDRYRHVVERLAKGCGLSEADVARKAVGLSQAAAGRYGIGEHTTHVGYYLIDRGLSELEQAVGVRLHVIEWLRRGMTCRPLLLHLSSIAAMTLLFGGWLIMQAEAQALSGWALWLLGALSLLAASQLASALSNWLSTLLAQPLRLPRMNFSQGLPASMRTLVVVPTLLGSAQGVDELLEALEVHFLCNRDDHLHFGLLTDVRDAAQQYSVEDESLIRQASEGIERLNQKYPSVASSRFFLFHRPRRWNVAERVWMGYERKRGKLADLNAALRGEMQDRFERIVGDIASLSTVRYVITLDTDTQMPRDAARVFIGVMAHPLHRPRYDEGRQRVCGGYGILQPRLMASLAGSNRSRYSELFSSEPGIDPYTRSVSDVYQDLFGEGSFIGKGIYEVDAFEQTLKDRFPDNLILSHDLLEGCYARSGLLSDAYLLEAYPMRYQADVSRQRRWIRGDWQLARWLLPRVPGPKGSRLPNPLSPLSRWKLLDNLRRSLVPTALTLLLLLGWAWLSRPWLWTLAVTGVVLIPSLLSGFVDVLRKPVNGGLRQHLASVAHTSIRNLALAGFKIACLPYELLFSLDAIGRTLWRMLFSHRGLLEWNLSADEDRLSETGCAASYRTMWIAPAVAVTVAIAIALSADPWAGFLAATPVLCLWWFAPALAWWLSRPNSRRAVQLHTGQILFLRKLARKTWAFFERYVVAADHWLPPDNMQEWPGPVIAHRTSPTNIGMALLANLSASDFGYLPTGALLNRSAQTFHSMARLERYRGHFYNWYDTQTLAPLAPRYVSTVDSGNLAGHLLTLGGALSEIPGQSIVHPRLFEGLADTLAVFEELAPEAKRAAVGRVRASIDAVSAPAPATLNALASALNTLTDAATAELGAAAAAGDEASLWAQAFLSQCRQALAELHFLAPWLTLPDTARGLDAIALGIGMPSLRELEQRALELSTMLRQQMLEAGTPVERQIIDELCAPLMLSAERAAARIEQCESLAQQAGEFAAAMDYDFLYDRALHLLAIGYHVEELKRDTGYYDLLASEARLCTFVAIAQGKLPQESWFALGRLLVVAGGAPMLVSWSGSMFEYLMPLLVMPSYEGTLLDQTCRAVVARQISYGQQRGLPWGVSESGYNATDTSLNYQYHAFGVPGLGLKRGLAEEAVIAPYASVLALMVEPEAACTNLQRLADDGFEGALGFYEAIDYTPARVPPTEVASSANQTRSTRAAGVVVRSFMAHHQGMSLLSLAHLLLDRPMQRRFASVPQLQATLLLLQERIPKASVFNTHVYGHAEDSSFFGEPNHSIPLPIGAETVTPEVQLLSNGRYHVMVTNAGGGYSRWKDLALTRWREDGTCDHWGAFLYLRDTASNDFWSASHQPTLKRAEHYEAMFTEGRAEYRRRDHGIESYCEIVVSPEDDIELRRLRLTNRTRARRTIEVTSYAEVVLAPPAADAMQPGFGNLFVQTELLDERRAILCTRRARSLGEPTPWMFHLLATHDTGIDEFSFETDRLRFIGRGHSLAEPQAMYDTALSGSMGSVLDPIVAIRCRVMLEPGQTVSLDFVTGVADQREGCLSLIDKYQDRHLADRVFDLAWTHAGVTLRQINASEADAQIYRRLGSAVVYANATLRAEPNVLLQNRRGQSGLWGYAISGDLPIVLLKIGDSTQLDLARQLIQCHTYWRLKGLTVDLVIWNEDHISYRQRLQDQIMGLIATGIGGHAIDRPGGIFVRSAEQISSEDRILLQAVARVIIAGNRGSLSEQSQRRARADVGVPRLLHSSGSARALVAPDEPPAAAPDLLLENGYGGFSADGREYHITTTPTLRPPLPWVNVLANPQFGSVVSEAGMAYSWSENAHEFRLTPWNEDPIGASGGEAFYLRDEDTGDYWSPTPMPCPGSTPYLTRHGFGYSVFEHTETGIRSELWTFVDLVDPVKFSVLKLYNVSGRARRLSVTGYVEWVLGDLRTKSAMHVVTEIDATSGALFARNAYNTEFEGRVAFFDVDDSSRTLTGDRGEFLGRNGRLSAPEAMTRARLSGRLGAGLDPCGAIQLSFELPPEGERQVIFRLGAGLELGETRQLVQRLRVAGAARSALKRVQDHWHHTLSAVQVQTPDPALDLLANGWLIYQTLACRFWARSGLYQSGGAFGFRDQLQDAMALVHAQPALLRRHLLLCAQRQYPQGDVQHWWHPPAGRGVRTRCSDDYLWLPLATCRYVQTTGDAAVLDEALYFLEGRELAHDEESCYELPRRSDETASLYQHCVRAIEHGLRFGEHGLPLMGSGDWNDGMNLVGIEGRGESVWLGFFLHEVLNRFAELALRYGDASFALVCRTHASELRLKLREHAWDGDWYRRAWFDDGSVLGSASNEECSIDSISQSWSVLSGAGDDERSRLAMDAMERHLVRRGSESAPGLVQLLAPPFDVSALNPGYIKGYVPGVRENGGQYTHAAIWAAMAFAQLGEATRAWSLMRIINPVNHALTEQAAAVYKTEPYVVAADVYAVAPHTGRGGWSWYTGSAGWLYRLIIESLLGLNRDGERLHFNPCLPAEWSEYAMTYRYGQTIYNIRVVQQVITSGSSPARVRVTLDGIEQPEPAVPLFDDLKEHRVTVDVLTRAMG